MKYLGERGGKAEVNDAGRIRRLPFTGQGVPPEPGTRVNPQRDSCCCPKGVELNTENPKEGKGGDSRRQVAKNTEKIKTSIKIVPGASLDLISLRKFPGLGWMGGYGGNRFESLRNFACNFVLYRADLLYVPLLENWIEWDSKSNTFKVVRIPLNKVKNIYLWSEQTFAGFIEALPSHPPLITGAEKVVPVGQVKNPRSIKLKLWVFDTLRGGQDDGFGGRSPLKSKDTPGADQINADWRVEEVKSILQRIHPNIEIYVHFNPGNDVELFKKWYRSPKNFDYERIY